MTDPDFSAYKDGPVSQKVAYALWFSASVNAAVVDRDPARAVVGLPPLARPWIEDPVWARKLADAYGMVCTRLALGVVPVARTTAEELALHMVLAVARASVADGVTPEPEVELAGGWSDEDFYRARRALLPDDDLLLLFDPVFDGVDDPGATLNRTLGIGERLHPSHWHDTFAGYASAGPLESIEMVSFEVDEGALHAAADLATRSGGREFRVFHTDDDATEWVAEVRYPRGVDLRGHGTTAHDAADDLVRAIVAGAPCNCGRIVTVGPYPPSSGECLWFRDAGRWRSTCS